MLQGQKVRASWIDVGTGWLDVAKIGTVNTGQEEVRNGADSGSCGLTTNVECGSLIIGWGHSKQSETENAKLSTKQFGKLMHVSGFKLNMGIGHLKPEKPWIEPALEKKVDKNEKIQPGYSELSFKAGSLDEKKKKRNTPKGVHRAYGKERYNNKSKRKKGQNEKFSQEPISQAIQP